MAHDFNNILAAIVGFGEMAREASPPGSDQARHLDRVLKAAVHGKAIIGRILTFSRGGPHPSIVFELEPVIEEVLTLLAASLRPGMILERQFEAPAARLRGDPAQAFEAIMNLCVNGMQAMPDGGMLSVRLRRLHVPAPRVLSHSPLAAGNYLLLTVSDRGSGITAAVMEHLFEPFFTTRGADSGTGLGLSVVHGVVTDFGGAIDVQSRPGDGARFSLYFPGCDDAIESGKSPTVHFPMGIGQALMIVDDEPALVALAEEVLKSLGYTTATGYGDPLAALAAFRAHPGHFAAMSNVIRRRLG